MKDPVQGCHKVGPSFAAHTSAHDHIIFHFDKYGLMKYKVTRRHKVYYRVTKSSHTVIRKITVWLSNDVPAKVVWRAHLSTAVAWREKKVKHFVFLQIFLSDIRTT